MSVPSVASCSSVWANLKQRMIKSTLIILAAGVIDGKVTGFKLDPATGKMKTVFLVDDKTTCLVALVGSMPRLGGFLPSRTRLNRWRSAPWSPPVSADESISPTVKGFIVMQFMTKSAAAGK